MKTHKKRLLTEMALALGIAALAQPASAAVVTFSWSGMMTMLDPAGEALLDNSAAKGADPYHIPITGVMTYDTVSKTGTAYSSTFFFFGNPSPSVLTGASIQAIGDGAGNPGSLMLMNGGFNWGGANAIPFSVVLDASGLFAALPYSQYAGATISGLGSRPASDGTYVGNAVYPGVTDGYLDLGPVPIATTKWNVTPTCPPGGGNTGACMNDFNSGALPLVADTATNLNDYDALFMDGDGSYDPGIGGSPFLAGPFESFSMNLEFTSLTVTSVTAVPVPAAIWLLGSGLVGLIGAARRRRCPSIRNLSIFARHHYAVMPAKAGIQKIRKIPGFPHTRE